MATIEPIKKYDPAVDEYPPMAKLIVGGIFIHAAINTKNKPLMQAFLGVLNSEDYFPRPKTLGTPAEIAYSNGLASFRAMLEDGLGIKPKLPEI